MAQSYLRRPIVERLPVILEDLFEGALRIPRFQRPFIWDDEQRLRVLDSVKRGLPIGSLMVWRTGRTVASAEGVGQFVLPVASETQPSIQYLLDGRQRVTTLFAALGAAFFGQRRTAPRYSEDAKNETWDVYFDLSSEKFILQDVEYQPEKSALLSEQRMPLFLVLDTFARSKWLRNNLGSSEDHDRVLWQRAEALAASFNDYLIPIVPIVSDDLEVVSLSFRRVNQGGTEMGDFDLVHALTWSPSFDLGDRVRRVMDGLEAEDWEELGRDWVLKVIACAAGMNPFRFDAEGLAKSVKRDPHIVEDASRATFAAINHLVSWGIRSPRTLPYAYHFLFLARLIVESPTKELHKAAQEKVRSWVWATSMSSALGGVQHDWLSRHWRAFKRWVSEGGETPRVPELARECRRFNYAHARSRVLVLALLRQTPLLPDGSRIDDVENLVARAGNDAVRPLIASDRHAARTLPSNAAVMAGKEATASPANRFVVPRQSVEQLREALMGLVPCEPEFLRSHLVTEAALHSLRSGDVAGFLELRRQEILRLENALPAVEVFGMRVEDGGTYGSREFGTELDRQLHILWH